jgi:hypothetical protein
MTYHKPLTFALALSSEPWMARQFRHLLYIANFTGNIQHMADKDNVVFHPLRQAVAQRTKAVRGRGVLRLPGHFRHPQPTSWGHCCSSGLELHCLEPAETHRRRPARWSSQWIFGGVPFLCDISTGSARPVIPATNRRRIFDIFHSLAHKTVNVCQGDVAGYGLQH